MKKTLLLGSFAIFAMVANAQVLVTQVTSEELEANGFSSEGTNFDAGKLIAEGEAGKISIAYDSPWKNMAPKGGYSTILVNGEELSIGAGVAGSGGNPTFANYASGAQTGEAVFAITPSKDGWLTVFTKLNPNKQYVVFEGKTTGMAYHLGFSNGTETIEYTLPFTPDYDIDFNAPDAANYFVAAGGEGPEDVKPQFPWIVADLAEAPKENTGFVTFNVVGGNTYYFSALGSKAAGGYMVLTEGDEPPTIKFLATDELPEVAFGPGFSAGIEGVIADPVNVNAPVYNLMGQKVDDTFKGIVIQNGKKFIRR